MQEYKLFFLGGLRKFANAYNPEEKSMGHQCRNIPK